MSVRRDYAAENLPDWCEKLRPLGWRWIARMPKASFVLKTNQIKARKGV